VEKLTATGIPAGEDFTVADLWEILADVRESAEDAEGAKAAYSKAADLYGEMAKESNFGVARGANLERLYCLGKAGRLDEAKALGEKLTGAYGEEYTFHYYFGRVLFDAKDFARARPLIEKAKALAYGDNWLSTVELMAKLDLAQGRLKEARSEIETALGQTDLPALTTARGQRWVARLRKLETQIEEKANGKAAAP
jgi:predicted Zn-dependent protease